MNYIKMGTSELRASNSRVYHQVLNYIPEAKKLKKCVFELECWFGSQKKLLLSEFRRMAEGEMVRLIGESECGQQVRGM